MNKKVFKIFLFLVLVLGISKVNAISFTEGEFEKLDLPRIYVVGDYVFDIAKHNPTLKDLMLAAQTEPKNQVSIVELKSSPNLLTREVENTYTDLLTGEILESFPEGLNTRYVYRSEIGIEEEDFTDLNTKELAKKPIIHAPSAEYADMFEYVDENTNIDASNEDGVEWCPDGDLEKVADKFIYFPHIEYEFTNEELGIGEDDETFVTYEFYEEEDDEYVLFEENTQGFLIMDPEENRQFAVRAVVRSIPNLDYASLLNDEGEDDEESASENDINDLLSLIKDLLLNILDMESDMITYYSDYSDLYEITAPSSSITLDIELDNYNVEAKKYVYTATPIVDGCQEDCENSEYDTWNLSDDGEGTLFEGSFNTLELFVEPATNLMASPSSVKIYYMNANIYEDEIIKTVVSYERAVEVPAAIVLSKSEDDMEYSMETGKYRTSFSVESINDEEDAIDEWYLFEVLSDNSLNCTVSNDIISDIKSASANECFVTESSDYEGFLHYIGSGNENASEINVEFNANETKELVALVEDGTYSVNEVEVTAPNTPFILKKVETNPGDEPELQFDNENNNFMMGFGGNWSKFSEDYTWELYYKGANNELVLVESPAEAGSEILGTVDPETTRTFVGAIYKTADGASTREYSVNEITLTAPAIPPKLVPADGEPEDGQSYHMEYDSETENYSIMFTITSPALNELTLDEYPLFMLYEIKDNGTQKLISISNDAPEIVTATFAPGETKTIMGAISDETGKITYTYNEITLTAPGVPLLIEYVSEAPEYMFSNYISESQKYIYDFRSPNCGEFLGIDDINEISSYTWKLVSIDDEGIEHVEDENEFCSFLVGKLNPNETKTFMTYVYKESEDNKVYSINNVTITAPGEPFVIQNAANSYNLETGKYDYEFTASSNTFCTNPNGDCKNYVFGIYELTNPDSAYDERIYTKLAEVNSVAESVVVSLDINETKTLVGRVYNVETGSAKYVYSANEIEVTVPDEPFVLLKMETNPGDEPELQFDSENNVYMIDLSGKWNKYLATDPEMNNLGDYTWELYYRGSNNELVLVDVEEEIGGSILATIDPETTRTFVGAIYKTADGPSTREYSANEITLTAPAIPPYLVPVAVINPEAEEVNYNEYLEYDSGTGKYILLFTMSFPLLSEPEIDEYPLFMLYEIKDNGSKQLISIASEEAPDQVMASLTPGETKTIIGAISDETGKITYTYNEITLTAPAAPSYDR